MVSGAAIAMVILNLKTEIIKIHRSITHNLLLSSLFNILFLINFMINAKSNLKHKKTQSSIEVWLRINTLPSGDTEDVFGTKSYSSLYKIWGHAWLFQSICRYIYRWLDEIKKESRSSHFFIYMLLMACSFTFFDWFNNRRFRQRLWHRG